MDFKYQRIKISEINLADASFQLSESGASPVLVHSIASIGLLNPPALLIKNGSYTIVSGFARVDACHKLGIAELIARVIKPDTPLKNCVQLAVLEKAFQKELNTVQQARAVHMLEGVCDGVEDLISVAKHLGLSVNQKIIEKLNIVNQMPACLRTGLSSGAIALPVALQLHNIKESDVLEELCQLFLELNLSLNRQRALLESLRAISKREQIGFKQLLAERPLQTIRQNILLDRRQKASQIRHYLKQRRSPSIALFESNYNELINKLRLKKGVRILAPANLEARTYSLKIDFDDIDEMKAMQREVQRILRSPYMAQILDQLKTKL